MNGDQREFLAELDKRLAVQEEVNRKQAIDMDEKFGNIKQDTGKIYEKLDQLPCQVHESKIKDLNMNLIWNRRIYITGFVMVFIVAIIKIAFLN